MIYREASGLVPVLIQSGLHVCSQLRCTGCQEGDALALCGHLVQCCGEALQELSDVLIVDIGDIYMIPVLRNDLLIEQQRVGNLDGVVAVRSYKQLCVIEVIEVVQGTRGTELDALDLLEVDVVNNLLLRVGSAVLDTSEDILQGVAELSVEQRRGGRIVDGVVAFLSGIVYDLAAVDEEHELARINMDHGTVGHDI